LNAETSQFELSLPNAVQQLEAGDRDRCIAEPLETEHHGDALLHTPMVLLVTELLVERCAFSFGDITLSAYCTLDSKLRRL
jgi:hypothetical protein